MIRSLGALVISPAVLFPWIAIAQRNDLGAERIYEQVKDAVVKVRTYDSDNTPIGIGSGIVLKSRAWLLTNYHVFGKAKLLVATHEGLPFKLDRFIRADAQQDILIVAIDSTHDPALWDRVPELQLVDRDSLRIGQRVYAIGNPFGLENTITEGIVSGLRSFVDSTHRYVQISAPISSGSSGGAVVNGMGRLVGMSTFIMGDERAQNLNFAIPIEEVVLWNGGETRMDMSTWDPDDPLLKGIDLVVAERWTEAVAQLRKVSPMREDDFLEAGYLIGYSFEQQHQLDSAYVIYRKVVHRAPWHAKAHLGLSRIYQWRGQWESALREQKMAYEMDPRLRHMQAPKRQ